MQPTLITGSSEKNRIHKVEEIVGKKISKLENNPDFLLLKVIETSIGIEEVRSLQKYVSLKPYQEDIKIVLIKEAQNLTIEAQNALLKTLEEPPDTVQIILTAPDSAQLIPTIISRCHLVDLGSQKPLELTEEDEKNLFELLQKIMSSTNGARLKIIEKEGIAKDRASATKWLDKLMIFCHHQLIPTYNSNHAPNILSLATQTKKYLDANCNVKLTMDNFVIGINS